MTSAVDGISASEDVGRRVFSSQQARKALRSGIPPNVFLPPRGETALSIDRLSAANRDELATLARAASESRPGSFHGWASVPCEDAQRDDREVRASPTPENPYHGEIILPDSTVTNRRERMRHAEALAKAASWEPDPASMR